MEHGLIATESDEHKEIVELWGKLRELDERRSTFDYGLMLSTAGPRRDEYLLVHYLGEQVAEEGEQLRTRLLGKEPELWSKVDRLLAEAEFRYALAPPLCALAAALAWRVSAWCLLVAAIAALALVLQGRRREEQSNDALVEALRVDRVQSPTLDGLAASDREAGT